MIGIVKIVRFYTWFEMIKVVEELFLETLTWMRIRRLKHFIVVKGLSELLRFLEHLHKTEIIDEVAY